MLAVVLATLEVIAPGFFLIWLAAAALLTGILTWITGMGWMAQCILFAVLSVIAVVTARRFFKRNPIATDDPALNRRGARMVGEIVVVSDAIVNGRGRVQVGDGHWIARGPDAPVGARVRITGASGAEVTVELA